jgi:hypothetical protein
MPYRPRVRRSYRRRATSGRSFGTARTNRRRAPKSRSRRPRRAAPKRKRGIRRSRVVKKARYAARAGDLTEMRYNIGDDEEIALIKDRIYCWRPNREVFMSGTSDVLPWQEPVLHPTVVRGHFQFERATIRQGGVRLIVLKVKGNIPFAEGEAYRNTTQPENPDEPRIFNPQTLWADWDWNDKTYVEKYKVNKTLFTVISDRVIRWDMTRDNNNHRECFSREFKYIFPKNGIRRMFPYSQTGVLDSYGTSEVYVLACPFSATAVKSDQGVASMSRRVRFYWRTSLKQFAGPGGRKGWVGDGPIRGPVDETGGDNGFNSSVVVRPSYRVKRSRHEMACDLYPSNVNNEEEEEEAPRRSERIRSR